MTRSRMSLRSVVRSAISPPSFSNWATKVATASVVAATAGLPAPMCRRAARIQPRSRASAAVATMTSLATPVVVEARSVNRAATVSAASEKRAFSASRSSSGTMCVSTGSWGRGRVQPAGAYAMPGTTPVPVTKLSVLIPVLPFKVNQYQQNPTQTRRTQCLQSHQNSGKTMHTNTPGGEEGPVTAKLRQSGITVASTTHACSPNPSREDDAA